MTEDQQRSEVFRGRPPRNLRGRAADCYAARVRFCRAIPRHCPQPPISRSIFHLGRDPHLGRPIKVSGSLCPAGRWSAAGKMEIPSKSHIGYFCRAGREEAGGEERSQCEQQKKLRKYSFLLGAGRESGIITHKRYRLVSTAAARRRRAARPPARPCPAPRTRCSPWRTPGPDCPLPSC